MEISRTEDFRLLHYTKKSIILRDARIDRNGNVEDARHRSDALVETQKRLHLQSISKHEQSGRIDPPVACDTAEDVPIFRVDVM